MGRPKLPCLETGILDQSHLRKKCRGCKRVIAKNWAKTPKGILSKKNRRPEPLLAKRASWRVRYQVKLGTIPHPKTLKCVDCSRDAHCYDHRDYKKPLQVEPVCTSCNVKRGPAKNRNSDPYKRRKR